MEQKLAGIFVARQENIDRLFIKKLGAIGGALSWGSFFGVSFSWSPFLSLAVFAPSMLATLGFRVDSCCRFVERI